MREVLFRWTRRWTCTHATQWPLKSLWLSWQISKQTLHSNELGGHGGPRMSSAGKLYSSYCHSECLSNGSLKPKGHRHSQNPIYWSCVCGSVCLCMCVCVRAKGRLIRFSGGWTLMTAERSIPLGLIWNSALHWWENYLSLSLLRSFLHSYSHPQTHTPPPFSSLTVFRDSLENTTKRYPLDLIN